MDITFWEGGMHHRYASNGEGQSISGGQLFCGQPIMETLDRIEILKRM